MPGDGLVSAGAGAGLGSGPGRGAGASRTAGAAWSTCPRCWTTGRGARLGAVLAGCGEDQVAVRAGRGVRAGGWSARRAAGGRRGAWVPPGTVLVTGGTGAIGGHVARWLAGRGARAGGAGQPVGAGCGAAWPGWPRSWPGRGRGRGGRLRRRRPGRGWRACWPGSPPGPPLTAVVPRRRAGRRRPRHRPDTHAADLAAVLAAKAAGAAAPGRADRAAWTWTRSCCSPPVAGDLGQRRAGRLRGRQRLPGRAGRAAGAPAGLPATSVAWGPWGGGGDGAPDAAATQLRPAGAAGRWTRGWRSRRWAQALDSGESAADGGRRRLGAVRARRSPLRRPSPLIAGAARGRRRPWRRRAAGDGAAATARAGAAAGRAARGRSGTGC